VLAGGKDGNGKANKKMYPTFILALIVIVTSSCVFPFTSGPQVVVDSSRRKRRKMGPSMVTPSSLIGGGGWWKGKTAGLNVWT
jgi:hypothetical protein